MTILRVLAAPLAFLALSIYHAMNGNSVASALSGAVFVMLAIYLLFPFSKFTNAAFVNIGPKIREEEIPRAYHLRCAGYWAMLALICVLLLFLGGYGADQYSSLRNSALVIAVVFFASPIVGVMALVKVIGALFMAYKAG